MEEDESAGAGRHCNVGSEGQLVVQCHTQVPCSLSRGHNRVLNGDGEVVGGRQLPWKEEHLRLVQIELQVVR